MEVMEVSKILLEWSFKSKDYYMAYILFTDFNIGIPNHLLYSLEDNKIYNSITEFISDNCSKNINDKYLNDIAILLKKSK
jgi:hypothetical protein